MKLDIRFPIGLLFGIFGGIITVFGLISDPAIYQQHSLGINMNLRCGIILMVFSMFMLVMAWRAERRQKKNLSKK